MTRLEFFQELRRFIRIWQRSSNLDEVARRLKMEKSRVQVLRLKLKRNGVELKEMPRTVVGKRVTPPTLSKKHWKRLKAEVSVTV